MSAFQGIGIVTGVLAGGFTCLIVGFLCQNIEDIIYPIMLSMGMSQTCAYMMDGINYAVDSMPILGIIMIVLAVFIWLSQRG